MNKFSRVPDSPWENVSRQAVSFVPPLPAVCESLRMKPERRNAFTLQALAQPDKHTPHANAVIARYSAPTDSPCPAPALFGNKGSHKYLGCDARQLLPQWAAADVESGDGKAGVALLKNRAASVSGANAASPLRSRRPRHL